MKTLFSSLLIALLCTGALQARTVYVNAAATGNNSGSSWADAYSSLATAISSALDHDTLWVAAGTYMPGTTRGASFNPAVANLHLFGGFVGTETSLSQRDFRTNVTTLSGDIGTIGTHTDNSYHIFTVNANTVSLFVADGFTLKHGFANGTSPDNAGGAIRVEGNTSAQGAAKLRNCVVSNNYGTKAGAFVVVGGGILWVDRCWVHSNVADGVSQGCSVGYNEGILNFVNSVIDNRNDAGHLAFDTRSSGPNTRIYFCTIFSGTLYWQNTALGQQFDISHSICMSSNPAIFVFMTYTAVGSPAKHSYINAYKNTAISATNSVGPVVFPGTNTGTLADYVPVGCSNGVNYATQAAYDALVGGSTDILGNPRNAHGMVDIGALEVQGFTGPGGLTANPANGNFIACQGQPATVSSDVVNQYVSTPSIKWQVVSKGSQLKYGSTVAYGLMANLLVYNTVVNEDYFYVVTNGCASDTSDRFNLELDSPGVIDNTPNPDTWLCVNGKDALPLRIPYTTPPTNPGNGIYTWYKGGTSTPVGTADSLVVTTGGYYYCIINYCGFNYYPPGYLVNADNPYTGGIPALTQQGNTLSVVNNYTLENYWFLNGVAIDTVLNGTPYSPTIEGTYQAGFRVTGNGCDTLVMSNTLVFTFVSADKALEYALTLTPNPATDLVTIETPLPVQEVRLLDLTGKMLLASTETTLSVANLPAGMYLVQVQTMQGTVTRRLTVE